MSLRGVFMSSKVRGELFIVTAAVLWGTLGVAGRIAYQYGCTPGQLMFYRMLFVLPFIVYALVRTPKRYIGLLLFFGAIIVTPFYLIYFYAVRYVGASTAALILYTAPAYVAVISVAFLGERLNWVILLALFMALLGAIFVNMGAGMKISAIGVLTAFLAALLYALYIVGAKKLVSMKIPSESVALVPYSISIPILFLYSLIIEKHVLLDNIHQLIAALYLSLFPTGLAYVLYNIGLRTVQASTASILSTVEPVSATVLAWILLGETITVFKLAGAALIVSSAIIIIKFVRSE